MPPKKSYDSDSEGQSPNQRGAKKQNLDKCSDEYKKRRDRNNVAVRKSREASRKKAKDTLEKVSKLREENQALEQKVTILNKELGVLRDLFLSHASATSQSQNTATPPLVTKREDTEHGSTENSSLISEVDVKDNLYFVSDSIL